MKRLKGTLRNLVLAGILCLAALCLQLAAVAPCAAQDHETDSLSRLLKTQIPDSVRASADDYLSFIMYQQGKLNASDSLAQKALQTAQKIGNNKYVGLAYNNIANCYDAKGDYPNALLYYNRALDINVLIGNRHGIENTLNNLGDVCLDKGDNFMALEYFNRALKLCRESGDYKGSALALENIGLCFLKQGIYPRALDSCFKSLEIRESLKDTNGIGDAYENIGNIYLNSGDYSKALENYNKALSIKEKEGFLPDEADLNANLGQIYQQRKAFAQTEEQYSKALKIYRQTNNLLGIATCCLNLGDAFIQQQKYDEALNNLDTGLILFRQIKNNEGIARSLLDIGACYYFKNNYNEALKNENEALKKAKDIGAIAIESEITKRISDIYFAKNDMKNALLSFKSFYNLNDSIFNMENARKTDRAELAYEFEKKEMTAEKEQEKKDLLTQAEIKRKNITLLFIIAVALAVLVIAIIIFRSLRITTKQKAMIEVQKDIVERQKTEVEVKNKEIMDSITYAKRLQDAILPPLSLIQKHFPESFLIYKPKDIVAGDFYWMERAGDNIFIAAADCTGHGVPGALVSVVCSNALNRAVKEFKLRDAGQILDKARELVLETFEKSGEEVKDGMDASFCVINLETYEAEFSGAYNPLWYIRNNTLTEIPADKQPIGKFDTPKPFRSNRIKLQKGDQLYFFTDGFSDQFGGPKGKKFKYKQLEEKLLAISHKPLAEQKQILEQEFNRWKGELEQVDDVLVIGIRV
jgi:tetratricopeptide (TPR) repeat protein/serine phosphatase RsbU (regulator of sigma subunit)